MFFALMVFLCGGLGAMTRFFLDKAMSPRLRTESSIISPVFVINLVGSFLYGLLIMPVSNPRALGVHYNATDQVAFWCTVITTGLLGGFTTFSTAMVEALTARSEGKMVKFLMLWLVQVCGCDGGSSGGCVAVCVAVWSVYCAGVPAGCSVLTAPAVVVLMVCLGACTAFSQFRLG